MKFKLLQKVPMGTPAGGWRWVDTGETIGAENEYLARRRGAGRLAVPPHRIRAEQVG